MWCHRVAGNRGGALGGRGGPGDVRLIRRMVWNACGYGRGRARHIAGGLPVGRHLGVRQGGRVNRHLVEHGVVVVAVGSPSEVDGIRRLGGRRGDS